MKRIFFVAALFSFFVLAEEKKLNATTAEWQIIQNSFSEHWPPKGNWQAKKFDGLIIPEYSGFVPVLQNFHIPRDAFPRMLDLAVGPPAEGIFRVDHKEITRYVEYINEVAFETDNNLEYLLDLSGEWSLDPEYRKDDYIIHFSSGNDNWIDLIINDKLFKGARGSLTVQGSSFPNKGKAIIKCSSIGKNKGLISVSVYKAYEQFIADPYRIAMKEEWFKKDKAGKSSNPAFPSMSWQRLTTDSIRKSPWLPEKTPAMYRQIYKCGAEEATKNVYISAATSIKRLWINNKEVDLNLRKIPDGIFNKGENEILYYADSISKGIKRNLEFHSVRPYWIKTSVTGSKKSVMSALLRGAVAKVYVNGQYAGVLHQEKDDEALGYGLFKDGANEIALCLLMDDDRTFLEEIVVKDVSDDTSLVLPWFEGPKELAATASGLTDNFGGYYLSLRNQRILRTSFKVSEKKDMELVFDSGKRFPDWKFKSILHAPMKVTLNGKDIKRTGHSFVLKAADLKDNNSLVFETQGMTIPEPIFYASNKAKPQIYCKVSRLNEEGLFLKPGVHFVGNKMNYLLDWDDSFFDKVEVIFNNKAIEEEIKSITKFSLKLEQPGDAELVVWGHKAGKKYQVYSEKITVTAAPSDIKAWLKDNTRVKKVILGETAFYDSESTLFPGKFKEQWAQREKITDNDKLDFGPLQSWQRSSAFSIFEYFPNGVPVFEKFGRRMENFIKLESGGYPVDFELHYKADETLVWKSASFTYQYLLWLESKKVKINWDLETLDEIKKEYVDGRQKEAGEFIKMQRETIVKVIKGMALQTAPGSTFKEVRK